MGADAGPSGPVEGFFLLSLYADLDTVLPRLAALGVGGEPTLEPVGPVRLAVVHDPNGVRVELMDEVARDTLSPKRRERRRERVRRCERKTRGERCRLVPYWQVAIIGAGAGGLGLAIKLAASGRRDFVLFEASDGIGGTWRSNTYPGAACDVPSHLYSYSFALKRTGRRPTAQQPEILRYFEDCADRFGIRPHLRPNTRIASARWTGLRRWRLTDAEGKAYESDVLVSAVGTFATPSTPDIAGLDSFGGPSFHSARWEHEHELAGKRVAVIGTGASAAQIIPEVAKAAVQVDVYQRTPNGFCPVRTSRSVRTRSADSPEADARPVATATSSTGPSRTPLRSATTTAWPTG